MNIETLATEIQEISLEIIKKDESIDTEKKAIAGITAIIEIDLIEIEKQVLFNPDYKNEAQRKLAIKGLSDNSEVLRKDKNNIEERQNRIIELEFDIKRLKAKKTYKETILKLEFIKLEKGV